MIYERGNFLPADTLETAGALACFAVGLVGYALVKILAPAFYAVDDPKTPARISLLSILVNLLLCSFLVGPLGHRGLALSTASVATLNALALWLLLRRKVGSLGDTALLAALLRIGLATTALWFTCRFSLAFLEEWLPGTNLGPRLVHVFGAIGLGGGVYLLVHRLLSGIRAR